MSPDQNCLTVASSCLPGRLPRLTVGRSLPYTVDLCALAEPFKPTLFKDPGYHCQREYTYSRTLLSGLAGLLGTFPQLWFSARHRERILAQMPVNCSGMRSQGWPWGDGQGPDLPSGRVSCCFCNDLLLRVKVLGAQPWGWSQQDVVHLFVPEQSMNLCKRWTT